MNRDEQKQISDFIDDTVIAAAGVRPSTIDFEADAIIRALFVRKPEAAYRMTMLAMEQARLLEAYRAQSMSPRPRRGWMSRLFKRPEARLSGDADLALLR